jgi:hypothetical protein
MSSAVQQYSSHNPTPPLGAPDGSLPVTGLDLAGLVVAILIVLVVGAVLAYYATRKVER